MSGTLTIHTIEHELNALSPQIAAMLPPDVSLEKFRQVALTAIRQQPDLLKCSQQSLFNACLNAAQDGLMPDGREGAIVARAGKATWQPMIAGIFKRVKSGGSVATLSANVVYEGEHFEVLLGDDDRIVHRRDLSKVINGKEVAVYAIAKMRDGSRELEVMTWDQVEAVRKSSAMPNAGPWRDWPDQMAKKSVIRRLAKRLPIMNSDDEALHRTIERVDSLYDFDQPKVTASRPAPVKSYAGPDLGGVTPSRSRRDATNAEVPLHHPAAPQTGADAWLAPLEEPNGTLWLKNLDALLANTETQREVEQIADHHSVGTAIAKAPAAVRGRVSEMLAKAYGKFAEAEAQSAAEPTPDDDDVVITGEEKLAAGDD